MTPLYAATNDAYLVYETGPGVWLLDAVSSVNIDVVGMRYLACTPWHDVHVNHGVNEQQQESCHSVAHTTYTRDSYNWSPVVSGRYRDNVVRLMEHMSNKYEKK